MGMSLGLVYIGPYGKRGKLGAPQRKNRGGKVALLVGHDRDDWRGRHASRARLVPRVGVRIGGVRREKPERDVLPR